MMTPRIISIIPARGGSKGVPDKNIRIVGGAPLIAHSIRQSISSKKVGRTYVSTDCPAIAEVAKAEGAEVIIRPKDLSGDDASSESALIHAIETIREQEGYQPDLIVFLQCTSPIRQKSDIDNAIVKLESSDADSLLSVVNNHRFIWEVSEGQACSMNYDYKDRKRRQDLKPQFCENGSIYIFKPGNLFKFNNRLSGKIALYEMSDDTGYEIDSSLDLQIIENIIQYRKSNEGKSCK